MNHSTSENTNSQLHPDAHSKPEPGIGFSISESTAGATSFGGPGTHSDPDTLLAPILARTPYDPLMTYASRPVLVTSGPFTSGSSNLVYGEYVNSVTLNPHVTNYTGTLGFRATICYRLEVAAAPQAQGIARLSWEPLNAAAKFCKSTFRAAVSTMRGAEVDLAEGASVELRIPYMYDVDYWYFNDSVPTSFGYLSVYPFAPVTWDTTTVSTPSYTLYRWLEDVELVGRVAPSFVIAPQGAEDAARPVTSFFKAATAVATAVASIPSLTAIAMPVSWVTGALAKVAAHYGWSKPNNGTLGNMMGMTLSRGHNTCADIDHAHPFAMYSDNQVEVLPGFAACDRDEMAFCDLTCKPALIASFPLLPTDTPGALKWTTPICPANFVFQQRTTGFSNQSVAGDLCKAPTANTNKLCVIPSPITYIASFFERWRGDLIFRVKFARTKFHAGRVLLGYLPGDTYGDGATFGGANVGPAANARYDYPSVIVDLRVQNVVDFEVPFTYPKAWADTGLAVYTPGAFSTPNTGVFFIRVIDPLYGPENVPQSVDVLVEVMAKCGLAFAHPITSPLVPVPPGLATLVAQAAPAILPSEKYAAGESINSVKQLMARPLWKYTNPKTFTKNYFVCSSPGAAYINFTWGGVSLWTPNSSSNMGAPIVNGTYEDNIIDRFAPLFSLWRGSLIYRVLPIATPSNYKNYVSTAMALTTVTTGLPNPDQRYSPNSVEFNVANDVTFPYYASTTRTVCLSTGRGGQASINRTLVTNLSGGDSPYAGGLVAGDDFQYGGYSGMPPVLFFEGYLDDYFNGGGVAVP